MDSFGGAIVISHNPVTAWETYSKTLDPDPDFGFFDLNISKRALGGYWAADFKVQLTDEFALDLYENGMAREMRVFSPKAKTVWEGMVSEVELNYGRAVLRRSLVGMANRSWMRYRVVGESTTSRSTKINDTDSQGKYGIKEQVLTGGELPSSTEADQAVQRFIDLRRNPVAYPVEFSPGAELLRIPIVTIKCRGYIWTLKWRVYNQTSSTGSASAATIVTNVIDDVGQYVATKSIDPNSTAVEQEMDVDRLAQDIVFDCANLGDSRNKRWVAGMWTDREFYFREAAPPTIVGVG